MEASTSTTEPIERIARHGAVDPDASVAGVVGTINVRFGAAIEALLNKRTETSTDQFRAIVAMLAQADVLSSRRTSDHRDVKSFFVAIEAAAADERETAVAMGAPVGEAFRIGHSLRCFGRAVDPLVSGDDPAAHAALIACGATILALISDLEVVGIL